MGNPFVTEMTPFRYLISDKNWPNFWPNQFRGGHKMIPKMRNSRRDYSAEYGIAKPWKIAQDFPKF